MDDFKAMVMERRRKVREEKEEGEEEEEGEKEEENKGEKRKRVRKAVKKNCVEGKIWKEAFGNQKKKKK